MSALLHGKTTPSTCPATPTGTLLAGPCFGRNVRFVSALSNACPALPSPTGPSKSRALPTEAAVQYSPPSSQLQSTALNPSAEVIFHPVMHLKTAQRNSKRHKKGDIYHNISGKCLPPSNCPCLTLALLFAATCVTKEKTTPYLHAAVCAIPAQCELFDVLKPSGQGLENLNQYRKRYGKINREIAKNSSPVMQLSKQECSRAALGLSGKIKPSTCTTARMKRRLRDTSSTTSTCPISIKKLKARGL